MWRLGAYISLVMGLIIEGMYGSVIAILEVGIINNKELFTKYAEMDMVKWNHLIDDTIKNQNDRTIVIVSASILEVQLEKIIKCFMIEDKKIDENLFSSNAPLSTFSAKIKMCYYLGLISEHEYNTLNTIRKIRNEYAHGIFIKEFNDVRQIESLCRNLSIPPGMYVPEYLWFKSDGEPVRFDTDPFNDNTTSKERYIEAFRYISRYLNYRILDIEQQKRKKYTARTELEELQYIRELIHSLEEKYIEMINEALRDENLPESDRKKNISEYQKINQVLDENRSPEMEDLIKMLHRNVIENIENSYKD